MLPLVALVGRPNVGKSTLFNALTRTRDALVHDEPGVTRDRNYGVCRLDEARPFVLVDTGGIAEGNIHLEAPAAGSNPGRMLAGATARQARAGAEEADLVLFVVDGREGPSALDDDLLRWLRKSARKVFLVVNKVDQLDPEQRAELSHRHPDGVQVSALTGEGLDDLAVAIEQAFARTLQSVELLLPYSEGGRLAELHDVAGDLHRDDTPEGVHVVARLPAAIAERYQRFAV